MRWVLAAGLAARLVVLAISDGFAFDLQGFTAAEGAFRELGLSAYDGTNNLWPYPPAYFPWLRVAAAIGSFAHTLRLPAVLADVALAWLAADLLRRRGAGERTCLIAAAVIMAAPIVLAHSAHHGQLDSVAIALGVGAVWVWTKPDVSNRALWAGLLIGLGGTVKTVPLLLVLALSPTARSWRERATLAATAGAVWLAAVVPFYLSAPEATKAALTYKGVPGFGGLSLILLKLENEGLFPTRVLSFLAEHSQVVLLGPALLVCAYLLHRRHVEPVAAAVVVWLTVYVFGFNFFIHYLIWALPFLVALGRIREAAVVAWAMAIPLATVYVRGEPDWLVEVAYTLPLVALWLACALALTRAARPAPAPSGTAT